MGRTRKSIQSVRGAVDNIKEPVQMRQTPVMFGIPMDEIMYSKFFTMFWRSMNLMPWDAIATTESTYLPDARNVIHNAFLEDSDYPYLMMVDSDVMCPPGIVDKLIAHKLPIVGGWYKNKNPRMPAHPIVYDFVSETEDALNWRHREQPGTGLEQVDGMGAGCWLLTREVAEALGRSPYSMKKGTEDLVFSKKLLDLGIPLHVDWDLACAHIGVSWV